MQAAKRGESLTFADVVPLAQIRKGNTKIELDAKRLGEIRNNLAARAAAYGPLRTATEISSDLVENLREWDIDGALKLKSGLPCRVDPKSLI
jgi:hypothetical protein